MTIKKEVMTSFSAEDNKSFEPEMKVGLLATINAQGQPHITILSTLQARKPQEMFFGQFAEGMSKENIRKNPKVGFLIMTLDKNFWRGKARFTHTATQGEEYDLLNNTPMFRYNSYFGIHTVFYMDLIEQYGKTPLPMSKVILGAVKTIAVKTLAPIKTEKPVLNEWTRKLIDKMDNLKFLCHVGADGYPQIIPVIQSQTSGTENVLFSTSAFGEELTQIPKGATVAFFCMSFSMETVLLRGVYQGISRRAGLECGGLTVNWVYSCMPPKSMQIYPELPIEAVREF
jgi:uncharacterized pyridoxamine 5'-phosphate oxidase family protein